MPPDAVVVSFEELPMSKVIRQKVRTGFDVEKGIGAKEEL